MFADTITIPYSSGNIVVTKINQDNYGSTYRFSDATHEVRLVIRHSKTAAKNGIPASDRHNAELSETVFATPTTPAIYRKTYIVCENFSSDVSAGCTIPMNAMANWLIASSNAAIVKLGNWES